MPQKTGLGLLLAQAAGLCLLLDVPLDFTQLRPEASAPHVLHPRSLLDGGSLSSLGVRLSSFSLFFSPWQQSTCGTAGSSQHSPPAACLGLFSSSSLKQGLGLLPNS